MEFPERPGSLLQFLSVLGNEYSISLFHYRNHGAAYGRHPGRDGSASGQACRSEEKADWLGYRWEETANPAYLEYLGEGERPVVYGN